MEVDGMGNGELDKKKRGRPRGKPNNKNGSPAVPAKKPKVVTPKTNIIAPVLDRFPELRKIILEHLAKYGDFVAACHAVRLSTECVKEHLSRCPEFLGEAEEAVALHRSKIEQAIHKRAIEGWDEPRFSSRGQIGSVRRFSDVLLMFYAKRHIKEYREADNPVGGLPVLQQNNVVLDFNGLNAKQKQALRDLLEGEEEELVKPIEVKISNNGKRNGNGTH